MSDQNKAHKERVNRVRSGKTSAMEEIANILGVRMTPEQRAQELHAQQERAEAKRKERSE